MDVHRREAVPVIRAKQLEVKLGKVWLFRTFKAFVPSREIRVGGFLGPEVHHVEAFAPGIKEPRVLRNRGQEAKLVYSNVHPNTRTQTRNNIHFINTEIISKIKRTRIDENTTPRPLS